MVIGLEEYALYEVKMQACNDVGCSPTGPTAIERTRESGKLGKNSHFESIDLTSQRFWVQIQAGAHFSYIVSGCKFEERSYHVLLLKLENIAM